MKIENSAVNITFARCENIKRQYILNEDILKNNFNEANILPIPDEAPVEIPRIIIKTKGEHSQLSIAPEAASFQTIYTDLFKENWDLCEEYVKNRIEDVFKLIDTFKSEKYKYIGIVTNLMWDEVEVEGNKVLFENLFAHCPVDNLDDLVVKYTYIENEKYYVNITLQSVRVYENEETNEAGCYMDEKLKTHTIGITLDVNDRYMFNRQKDYCSDKHRFEELLGITTMIINEKLKTLVEKGEY
ncbi:Uncharacterised protein [uncultured Clostridium sp.]|uniref:TIGR04255 family protein n=1 Tax=Muricoprocola aceti TaxID=2981772 RepID=A0ABT2SJ39_9FIRM|nr:hypothetical protein [Muricoprocola aceti]MCU6724517.1 hypothetical protein [Muricoprocola aceti]SCH17076.1 Uncharacterised protein [uncultured Clostridium sp.]